MNKALAGRLVLGLLAFVALASAATAQQVPPELQARAEQVVALLKGRIGPAEIFSPSFLAQVPPEQVGQVSQQLRAQHGAVRGLARIEPRSAVSGVIHVETERALLRMDMTIEPEPPHRITGLLVTGAEVRGDTLAAVIAEIGSLPGLTSVAVARLGEGDSGLLAAHEPDRPLAVGSTFKLFVLAELSRQVQAGERRWSDVVTIDRRSLPSGQLQNWPLGAPVTLHTLAALMISISDNSATDLLLHVLGRENVERMMTTIGVRSADRNQPFLSTLEMFALKSASPTDQQAWIAASAADRRRLLASRYGATGPEGIDPALFGGQPLRISELEWFASTADLVRTMDWLRRNGDDSARAILAINPGIGPALRGDHAYIGYKGGSEPGVLNLTWLIRSRAGDWHVVTGTWNNPAAPIDESRFIGLMARAVQLVGHRGVEPEGTSGRSEITASEGG